MEAGVSLARVRVPLGWALGILALAIAEPSPELYAAGLGLAALGEGWRLWAAGHLEKNRVLTTSGPYAHTRNPLYLGSLFVGLGFALATGRLVLVLVPLGLFALVYVPVMKREARRLADAFPETYAAYADSVPLFLPRARARAEGRESFRWERVKRNREHVTVLGLVAVGLFLWWRMAG